MRNGTLTAVGVARTIQRGAEDALTPQGQMKFLEDLGGMLQEMAMQRAYTGGYVDVQREKDSDFLQRMADALRDRT